LAAGVLASDGAAAAKKHSTPVVPNTGTAPQVLFERQVFKEINRIRRTKGLKKLRQAKALRRAARWHSTYQARIKRLTHEGKGNMKFSTRLVRFGYKKSARMSEVVGTRNTCERKDPKVLVKAWMSSPAHRVLVLDRKVRYMGVGVVSTKKCRQTFYTVDFGS
jgi:uncharacterized protein YkwD